MAVETAPVVILDHHNETAAGCGFSAFFDEEQLLLEALDAELAQELQFQEALRASLMISGSESPPLAGESQTPPSGLDLDSQPEIKWEAGESSQSFCDVCRERKEDGQVVRNVYYDNDGCTCVCFDCINVNASGKRANNGFYEKNKGKGKKVQEKKMVARRHIPANRSLPPRVDCQSLCELEEKLRMAKEEIRVLKDKLRLQHQESKEAMDFQEQFFKDQINSNLEGRS